MKSLMQFFTDGAIITLSLGLVVIAFLITVALSPIKFEESSFAVADTQSVLGEASIGELQFEPLWYNSTSTDVEVTQQKSDDIGMIVTLKFDKLEEPAKIRLLRVTNSSLDSKMLFLKARSASAIEKSLTVTTQNDKFETDLKLNSSEEVVHTLQGSQSVEYEVILEPLSPINFASEIVIEIWE